MKLEQFRLMTDRAQQAELDAMEEPRSIYGLPFAPILHRSAHRDWFAGLALTKDQFISDEPEMWRTQARRAYGLADAMLAERERKPEGEAKHEEHKECPVCGCDRNSGSARALMDEVLRAAGGVTSEQADPGGREIVVGGISIRLTDECNVCDLRTVLTREE